MPEIAEVERARLRIHRQCLNHKITHVETVPDTLVYKDIDSETFGKTILNRTLIGTKRYGKYFILLLGNDEGPHIVAHLGMTGGVRFKHEELAKGLTWPPKFHKLLVTFTDTKTGKEIIFGFKDPRRIARLRIVPGDPLTSEPINRLGFDPILCMPDIETFKKLVTRRAIPTKVLLLDQSFSAGVGNWVADEILFQARIHPSQYTTSLTDEELEALYSKMISVCEIAVKFEANEDLFPSDWLMKHRWNKGRSNEVKGRLPNGMLLQFETVGGRTAAFAPDLQKLRVTKENIAKENRKLKRTVISKEELHENNDIKKRRSKSPIKKEEDADYEEIKPNKRSKKSAVIKEEVVIKTEEYLPNRIQRPRLSTRYNFRSQPQCV